MRETCNQVGKCRNLRGKTNPLSINRPSNSWIGEGPLRRQEPSILEGPAALPLRITQRVLYWPGVDIGTLGQMGRWLLIWRHSSRSSIPMYCCFMDPWSVWILSKQHDLSHSSSGSQTWLRENQAFTGKPQQIWMVLMQIFFATCNNDVFTCPTHNHNNDNTISNNRLIQYTIFGDQKTFATPLFNAWN